MIATDTVRVTLALRTPLCLAADAAQGNETFTLPFIPGAALRGALAWRLLDEAGWRATDPAFARAIPGEALAVGDCTPDGALPLPRSARTCKLYKDKGFAADGGHGVTDLLLPTALAHADPNLSDIVPERCAVYGCPAPLDRLKDDALVRAGEGGGRSLARTPRAWRRFTARDPRTRAARVQQLFAMEVLQPEEPDDASGGFRAVTLHGELRGPLALEGASLFLCDDADGDADPAARPLLARGDRLWLGRGRARGFGEVEVTALAPVEPPAVSLAERLAMWDAAARQLGRDGSLTGFALTLESPTLLLDPWLRSLGAPTPAYLRASCGVPLPAATAITVAFAAGRRIPGWNGHAGLPRGDLPAIAAGSAFWVETGMPLVSDDDLVAALDRLEREGLGERRAEGFGRVRVASLLHLEVPAGI